MPAWLQVALGTLLGATTGAVLGNLIYHGFWPKKWTAQLVGTVSGNVYPLPFVEFRRESEAAEWCEAMNARWPSPVMYYRPSRQNSGPVASEPRRRTRRSRNESPS